jgi:pimeloyl-ACP methyl ester carboxylesterase
MEAHTKYGTVYYESHGNGTPIIMLNGFGLDHRALKNCMEPLFSKTKGWRRLYIDLPGTGKTKGMNTIQSTDDMLNLLLEWIDHVVHDQLFLLVGESYGGYLAQGVLAKKTAQTAGMALICPVVEPDHEKRKLPQFQPIVKDDSFLDSLTTEERQIFQKLSVIQNQSQWQRFKNELLPSGSVVDSHFLQRIKEQYAFSFPVASLAEPFDKPVLILTGKQDAITGYEDVWQCFHFYKRATFVTLDRAGHCLSLEQTTLLTALMEEWLMRVRESMDSF